MNIRWLFIEGGSADSTAVDASGVRREAIIGCDGSKRESLALERKKIWDGLARGDHQEAQSTLFNIQ